MRWQLADELSAQYPNLIVQKPDRHIVALHTKIRDRDCDRTNFVFYANRLNRLLMEEALGLVDYADKPVTTPTGNTFAGTEIAEELAAVSILRAGESMERVMWCVHWWVGAVKWSTLHEMLDMARPTWHGPLTQL